MDIKIGGGAGDGTWISHMISADHCDLLANRRESAGDVAGLTTCGQAGMGVRFRSRCVSFL